MQKVILCKGIPASGKSTWAKQEVAKDPNNWARINNDDLREMLNQSVWSKDYEKIITNTRNYLIEDILKRGKSIIIDNLNINNIHFEDVCKIVSRINADIIVEEKVFYIDLQDALERNSKRTGCARLADNVIIQWWNKSGRQNFKNYISKTKTFKRHNSANICILQQDKNLPKAAIFDLDGTMCIISNRNPYDTFLCEQDLPNQYVIDLCKMLASQNIKIFFFTGREDKFKIQTTNWLDKYFAGEYELHMRKSSDFRKDRVIKQEIFESVAKDKYNIVAVVDDRLQVCQMWHQLGLPIFRVGNPDATF
jgi:predicted kinase